MNNDKTESTEEYEEITEAIMEERQNEKRRAREIKERKNIWRGKPPIYF